MDNKWKLRYLGLAREVSTWSKDPSTQIGAVAVGRKGEVLAQGYNGFPRGVADNPDRYDIRELKYKYVVHAEMNVIYNASFNGAKLEGATLFVWGLPVCSECAKGVIQVGIKHVVMPTPLVMSSVWAESWGFTQHLFAEAGVTWEFIE